MGERYDVPCGSCPPCKLRRVQGWVFRLQQEEKRSHAAHFITLTYDTRTVPISPNGFMTLDKTDLQKFIKRLRKLCPQDNIRYYAVGEYGTTNKRPHYHGIFFNVPDVELFAKAWSLHSQQFGDVHVGTVTGASIAYTLKYIDKPKTRAQHHRDDRKREFSLMSKGLGSNYITDSIRKYHNDDINRNYITLPGNQKIALPRYYRTRLYDEADLKTQTIHIIKTIQQQNDENLRKYVHAINPEYPELEENLHHYERHLTSGKHERYRRFYSRQKLKPRN